MYCKNCGSELPENAEICIKCGFRKNIGEGFCPNCGKEVKKMQSLCLNCGFLLDDDLRLQKEAKLENGKQKKDIPNAEKEKNNDYVKHVDSMKRIALLKLVVAAVAVFMVVAIIFLPIYTRYVDVNEIKIDDIEDMEDFREAMQDGHIKKNFSFFDDIKQGIEEVFDQHSDMPFNLLAFIFIYWVPILEIVFIVVALGERIPKVNRQLANYSKLKKTSALKDKDIKKMGIGQKESSWDVITVISLAIFDVFVSKLLCMTEMSEIINRYMNSFAGVSLFAIIIAILFVAYLVMRYMINGKINEFLDSIEEETH